MPRKSRFNVKVRILGGLTTTQQGAFRNAAALWSTVIAADVPGVRIDGERIDDLVIEAVGTQIDGESGILGQAGPTHLRPGSSIPAKGSMEFDRSDLARMEGDGSLQSVIIHEMGHVIGIGTIWRRLGLLQGAGTANPVFVGTNAMREFGVLIGTNTPTPVPIENTGGPGTREGHWRESVFGNEIMTGFLNPGANPFSRLTVAALKDMGYQINFDAADAYALPSHLQLSMMGVWAEAHHYRCCASGHSRRGREPVVLSADDVLGASGGKSTQAKSSSKFRKSRKRTAIQA
jgi:hypothetical protein